MSLPRLLKLAVAGVAVLGLVLAMPAAVAGPLPTVVTAETSAANVVVGTKVTLSGTVTPPGLVDARPVVLQLQTATGWRELGRMATDSSGAFTFHVLIDWYGDHVLRVVAPATLELSEGASPPRTVSVTPTYAPRGSSSAWKRFASQARWDPCTVVQYRTNLRRAPKGALKLVTRAFSKVHAATGLTFHRAGRTKKVPFSGGPDRKQFLASGLVIAWTTPKVVRALAGSTAGVGGATSHSVNGGPWRYVYGGVSLDATQKLPVKGFREGRSVGSLLLHEIAHALGLDHVGEKSQLLFPVLQSTSRGRYEAGDLAGLRAVGAEQGCFPAGSARVAEGSDLHTDQR